MKVGVNLINFAPGATPEALTRWVQLTEALGYHLIMTSDHVAITPDVHSRYPAPFYEPLSTLGWLAGITRRMAIGTTVIIVPYRNPLETARVFANVDQLSGGRLIFGVGWAQQEFHVLGVPIRIRLSWFKDTGIPRLHQIVEQEQRPVPALCPRIRLRLTSAPPPDDQRVMGEGTVEQVRRDLEALQALGCSYVLLDTYHDDVEAIKHHETAWRRLTTMAEKVLDLTHETLK